MQYLCRRYMTRLYYILLALAVAAIVGIVVCNVAVVRSAEGRMYDDVDSIPYNRVGLVLGTSKYNRYGSVNAFYVRRLNACVSLYKAGKIDHVLISGDNSRKTYDEPTWMMQDLVEQGIPGDAIHLDYAGFRTLDSMVRAKEVFGLTSVTVISQRFHNERALFIAQRKGIDAVAFNAEDVPIRRWQLRMTVREWLARVNAVLDILIARQPHFLGEPIIIQ